MSNRVKRLIPWVLSLGVVAFLFATTDLAAVGDALGAADWPRLVGLMAVVTVTAYVVDSLTLIALFRRFIGRVSTSEVLKIKGVSYFFNALNYSLAAAAMAWILHKKRGLPFLETFSSLIWFFFVDIIALTVMMAGGLLLWSGAGDPAGAEAVSRVPLVIGVASAVVVGSLIYWNGRFDFVFFGRLRKWRIFHTFGQARLKDYPPMVAMRVGFVGVYAVMHWLLLPAFGVHIGLDQLLIYSPLITFVQVIPATISGLGAVQAVIVALFASHVSADGVDGKAIIVAYSTVIGPLMMLMRLIIGYIFMTSVARDLVPTKGEVAAAREASAGEG